MAPTDLEGKHNGSATSDTRDYTAGSKPLTAPGGSWQGQRGGTDVSWWLRSPRDASYNCAIWINYGYVNVGSRSDSYGVRPALWSKKQDLAISSDAVLALFFQL